MAKAKKLTPKGLAALKPKAHRYDVQDADRKGLFVRVGTGGTLTYIYRYQLNKTRRVMVLGQHGVEPTKTLEHAHALHGAAVAKVREGIDPQGKPKPKAKGYTMREIAEEFRDRHLEPNVKTWGETWRIIEKDILSEWENEKADEITPREVVELLDGILDRGALRMANKVRSILFQMFRFAVGRGMAESSPVMIVSRPSSVSTTRERILADDEVRAFWRKIDEIDMLPRLRHALRLLLITGQRRGEVAHATWEEFDLEAKLWSIPATRTKNGKPHIVPLTKPALDTLKLLRSDLDAAAIVAKVDQDGRYAGAWLFPSPHWTTGEPIDPKAVTRAVSRNREHWGIEPFTVHDLRRTVRSNLAALGVSPIVARKVVNHTLDGMDAVYDRHDYADEKRQALELWATRLQAIIEGKKPKVAPLRAAS